jgi:hypothetical protein
LAFGCAGDHFRRNTIQAPILKSSRNPSYELAMISDPSEETVLKKRLASVMSEKRLASRTG